MADPQVRPFEPSRQKPATRRTVLSRLSLGHVIMLVSGLLGVILTYTLLRERDEVTQVAVASESIEAGTVVTADQFRLVEVDAANEQLDTLLTNDELESLEGLIAVNSIASNEFIDRTDFVPASSTSGLRAMSLPIEPQHAAGGALAVGDTVDVIGVRDGAASYLAQGIEVLSVGGADSQGGLVGARDTLTLTLAVDEQTALELAAVLSDGSIEIVRATGATSTTVPDATESSEVEQSPTPSSTPTKSNKDEDSKKGSSKDNKKEND
jgi:Flp pilus assembly protein CpaB